MKKAKKINLWMLASVCVLVGASCVKNTDCVAQINCADSNGTRINGADVLLYANVKTQGNGTVRADIKASGKTDASGEVKFTFKLPAVFDIKAIYKSDTAVSIIKLEEGKTVVSNVKFN